MEPNHDLPPFSSNCTSVDDVKLILLKMSNAKAMGEDGISVGLMKLNSDKIAEILTNINHCSKKGISQKVPITGLLAYYLPVPKFWKRSFILRSIAILLHITCYQMPNLDSESYTLLQHVFQH